MSRDYPGISDEQHRRILEEGVLRDRRFVAATEQSHPRAILLAGQPGSGKAGLAEAARAELHGNAVTVDPDALRRYHPRVHALQREFPYTWSGHTHADASQWADELREAAVVGRKNLIVDTTLSNGEWSSQMINELKAKGYEAEVRAVVAHRLESERGVDARFSQKLDEDGYARHVPEGVRTAVYDKIPAALDTVHERTGVPIRLYSREGIELYDSRSSMQPPGAALSAARDARLRDPAVLRQLDEGWSQQRDWHRTLPERLPENPRVDAQTADRLLAERAEQRVVEQVARNANQVAQLAEAQNVRATPFASGPALTRGTIAVGVVVAAADAAHTGRGMARDYAQDNATAAEAKLIDFSARTGGGLSGAGLGFAAGSAVGTPLIGGTVGAVAGAVAGDRIAEWHHRETIYTQLDSGGREWRMDPERPDQGWTHIENRRTGAMQSTERIVHAADAATTSELNFKASARSLELALGSPPPGANPHRLAASASDAKSDTPAPWNFDAGSGQWTRQRFELRDNGMDLGQMVKIGERPDIASPARAAQLDAQSRRIIEANAAMSAPVMAARFGEAYQANDWAAHGPMPPAVAAARTRFDEVVASDGERYQRDARGQWTQDGVILQPAASPLLHRELEQTRDAAMRQARMIDPPEQARHVAPDQRPEPVHRPAHDPRADADRPALPADFAPPLEQPHDLRSPLHPGHAAFNEMVHRVRVFEAQAGIPSGPHTEKLGAALLQVAVENKIGYQDASFERDAATGRIDLVNRRDIHASDPPRLPLDMAKLSSQPIEVSSQGVNEAVSRHYAEPVRAQAQARTPEHAQALAGLGFDDQVMFGRLRREVPGHIGDGHVLQAMAEAKRSDIPTAASVGGVMMFNDSIRITGKGEGAPVAQVDVSQPAPKPDVSVAAIQSQNQQQAVEQQVAQQMAQQQAQGQQQGAAMRLG